MAFPERLEEFFRQVCSGLLQMDMGLSVKTRLGVEEPEEFERLLEIYNQFPLTELIIHPRVLRDYYGNEPRLDWFARALSASRAPVCYNGDIRFPKDLERLKERLEGKLPDRVMLGRGLSATPACQVRSRGKNLPDWPDCAAFMIWFMKDTGKPWVRSATPSLR